jgi:hypothetical protein
MNKLTVGCAVVSGFAASAYYADYKHKKQLYQSAVRSMEFDKLAIVTSGSREPGVIEKHNFTVVKVTDGSTEVVGVIRYIRQYMKWKIEVRGNTLEMTPIVEYVLDSTTPLVTKISRFFGFSDYPVPPITIVKESIKKLPMIEPTEKENQNGYYSTKLYENWRNSGNGAVIRRQ